DGAIEPERVQADTLAAAGGSALPRRHRYADITRARVGEINRYAEKWKRSRSLRTMDMHSEECSAIIIAKPLDRSRLRFRTLRGRLILLPNVPVETPRNFSASF